MKAKIDNNFSITGPKGSLKINPEDKLMIKLAMIFDIKCLGKSPKQTAERYGYKKQRYYQILEEFEKHGTSGLIDKKKGPKRNSVRNQSVVSQIIRYKFLEPEVSAEIILQKLKQSGISISLRSVERTITEYGLQKKTPYLKAQKRDLRARGTQD